MGKDPKVIFSLVIVLVGLCLTANHYQWESQLLNISAQKEYYRPEITSIENEGEVNDSIFGY